MSKRTPVTKVSFPGRSLTTSGKFCLFQSTNHVLKTVEMTKVCLSAFNDKQYILDDGINTLAYGHYSTKRNRFAQIRIELCLI